MPAGSRHLPGGERAPARRRPSRPSARPVRAGEAELEANPRARSATLARRAPHRRPGLGHERRREQRDDRQGFQAGRLGRRRRRAPRSAATCSRCASRPSAPISPSSSAGSSPPSSNIRALQTEVGTRGRLAQLEQWNDEVLALSRRLRRASSSRARQPRPLRDPRASPLDGQADVRMASAETDVAAPDGRPAPAAAAPRRRSARSRRRPPPPPRPRRCSRASLVRDGAGAPTAAPARPPGRPAARPDAARCHGQARRCRRTARPPRRRAPRAPPGRPATAPPTPAHAAAPPARTRTASAACRRPCGRAPGAPLQPARRPRPCAKSATPPGAERRGGTRD